MDTPNQHDVNQAWAEFKKTPECQRLVPNTKNSRILHNAVLAIGFTYSVHTLLMAYRATLDELEFKPIEEQAVDVPARAVTAQAESAAEPVETPEHELPGYPVRGGLEDGWKYQQRLTAWREQRAQQAWRERENKRLLEAPPAQSTIRRTRGEIRLRKLEQDLWNKKKANQS